MRYTLAFLAFSIASPATAEPQSPIVAPVATAEPETLSGEELAFETFDQRMTVPVQISGAGPYKFIVDTGAQRTVISHQLAGKLGLAAGPSVRLTAMSGTSRVGTVVIPSLSVSTLSTSKMGGERIEAPSLDARNLGAMGMLGIDTLQGHSVGIDFDAQTMAVTPSRKRGTTPRAGPDEIVIRARSLFGQLVVTDARIGRQRVRVILDTGTPVSMGNLALQKKVMRNRKVPQPVTFTSVTGGTIAASYTSIGAIEIGDATINDLPIAFADLAPFRAFGLEKKPAILLGMDALRLFRRVHIDFANRELRLALPRGTLRQPRSVRQI